MKASDNLTTVKEASELLDWDEKTIRDCLRAGVLTFGTAIKGTGGNHKYYIDKKTLYKCVSGEKELFRA